MNTTEARIIRTLINRALSRGYTVSVFDGEEFTVKRSRDAAAVFAALDTTGQDALVMRDADGRKVGTVTLTYNGDDTVISDHTDNAAMSDLTAFAS